MHTFDYSFLKDMGLSPQFASRLARIEGYRNNVSRFSDEFPETAKDMVRLSKIMSARESNDIEGISTHDTRLIGLLTGKVAPRDHDEAEILGYRDALERIHSDHSAMEISEDTILELFGLMVSRIDVPVGYKTRNNEVVERASDGRILKRFRTVPAAEVSDAIYQLLGAYAEASGDFSIPEILLIPCFVMDFLKIHPFIDGNGRMSRLLTILLLYRAGYDVCAYVSLEAIVNNSKDDYYRALESSGEGWFDNASDYYPFMDYFIGTLFLAYREQDRRMALCVSKENKENRIERIVTNVSLPISKREICMLMPDVSETYVELVLGRLLKEDRIERIGVKNSSRYLPLRRK